MSEKVNKNHIHVIGDSIGEGYYDLDKSGWVNRMKLKLYENRNYYNKDYLLPKDFIRNLSLSGDTAHRARQRVRDEFIYKASTENINIPIIALGVNDSYIYDLETAKKIKSGEISEAGKDVENINVDEPTVEISYKDFVDAYKDLLTIIAEAANEVNNDKISKIFILEITPCAEQMSINSPFEVSWTQNRIDLFNQGIKKIVKKLNEENKYPNKFEIISTRDLFPEDSMSDEMLQLIPDGIHPYKEGHELIANRVFDVLYDYLEET